MKVALCTIASRKDCCLRTLRSLLRQTVKPEIHLFVSEEPFLMDEGFPQKSVWSELYYIPVTVHWVPNWGPYRKTVSVMKEFPDDVFLAVDDDEEFAPDFVETALKHYTGGVMAFRATKMSDQPYTTWEPVTTPTTAVSLFHKGNGGVIYDSKLFRDPLFFDAKTFLTVAETNDDIWLNLWRMSRKIPVTVLPIDHHPLPQQTRLWFYNETKNDVMLQRTQTILKETSQ